MRDKQRTERGRGSTAQQKADRLRVRAEKLSRQADAWVNGADREPSVGRRLNELPRDYVVLHNVLIPGTNTRSDHVVVGGGGIYVVDSKKYSGRLVYSNKMLWHGRFPIADKLERVQWEADCLADAIGRPVVAVLCYVDQVLPQPVTTLGSVIVCRLSSLMTVVRSSHMTISRADIASIVEVLTKERTDDEPASIADEGDRAPLESEPRPASTFALEPPEPSRRPPRERRPRRAWHLVKVVIACVLGLLVAAGAVFLFSTWLSNRTDKPTAASTTTTVAPSTTTEPADTTTPTTVAAPQPQFLATCPQPGQGWAMVPVWPGTFDGLAFYDYSVQSIPDGAWIRLGVLQSPDPGTLNVPAIASGDKRIVRITPALRNGTAGDPIFVVVTAPTDPC